MFQDVLLDQIKSFLKKREPFKGPLILGYSGGFDSKALLYLLLKIQKQKAFKFELVLAHIDHSWREESAKEARNLKKEAKQLGLRFFLKTLSLDKSLDQRDKGQLSSTKNPAKKLIKNSVKNQEAVARDLRLEFFQKLYQELGASYLLLAHQKDDQVETVLKRCLEGADLPFLGGMQAESFLIGMRVLRPLLSFSKKELMEFLKENQLRAIEDRTNFDSKYLRSRMRISILPELNRLFGKNIFENLALLSGRSQEFKDYLEQRIKPAMLKSSSSPFGQFLDLRAAKFSSLALLERRYLIKKLALKAGFNLSRQIMEQVLCFVEKSKNQNQNQSSNKNQNQSLSKKQNQFLNQKQNQKSLLLALKEGDLIVENDKLFFWKKNQKIVFALNQKIALKKGLFKLDGWQLKISEIKAKKASLSSWQELSLGSAEIILPKDEYYLAPYQADLRLFQKRLSQHMAEQKVPLFLRKRFPVIFRKNELFCDLLSGRPRFPQKSSQDDQIYYKINLIIS